MTTAHSEAPTMINESSSGGLAAELLARRRKRLPAVTLALAILVAAAAAFIGGIEVHKHWGSSSSNRSSGLPAGFPGGAVNASRGQGGSSGGFPSFSGAGAFGGATSGTVTLIKGSTLYVTTSSGNTVLVHTSASARVTKSVSGSVKSIHPGDSVTVVGSQAKDGSYTARQVTIGGTSG